MKKLIFTAYSLDFGGIEKALLALLNNIDYTKYEVTLLLEKKEGVFINQVPFQVIVKEYKVSNFKIPIIRKIINRLKLITTIALNYNKYDFSCCYAPYCIPTSILARYFSKNNTIWLHSDYYYLYNEDLNKIRNFFNARSITLFKHIVFVANEAKEHFLEIYPILMNRTTVCNNMIDYETIIKLSMDRVEQKPNKTLFLNVSRHEEHAKKLTRLIESAKKLKDDKYDFEIWMIGSGPDTSLYEELIDNLDLKDNIKMLGSKQNPYPYYKMADAFVLTSEYEGFPVVYLESLAFNLPIITTIDVSDDTLSIKEKFGILIDKSTDGVYNGMKQYYNSGL